MTIDLDSARTFIYANARVLERHRVAALLDGAPGAAVVAALRALEALASVGLLDDPMVRDAAAWVDGIAGPDGGVPFVMPAAAGYPRGPWMVPSEGGSQLTFALAGVLWDARSDDPWLQRGTEWCWSRLEG